MSLLKLLCTRCSLCLLLVLNGYTQAEQIDEGAQKLHQLLQPITAISAQFRQRISDPDGYQLQLLEGIFQVAQPDLIRWVVERPMQQQVISDGETLWVYDPDLEQLVIQPFERTLGKTPALLFSANLRDLEHSYQVHLSPSEIKGQQLFTLTPRQGDSLYQRLRIQFDHKIPLSLELTHSTGHTTKITFRQVNLNPQLSADLFAFEIPDGVDIINNVN